MIRNHPLVHSLLSLRGNPKACVLTEPLWGIPYNLYMPFVALYMSGLGVSDRGIGILASVSLFFRAMAAFFSGAITDKLGRKWATVIFDCISWSVPCLLWTFSQNFWWFLIAASLNGLWQITENSWTCLLVEDAQQDQMVNIYSFIHMSGQLAVFFAPLSGLLVNSLNVVPAMRILYGFSFVSMTAKFLILFRYCDETSTGRMRLEQTRNQNIFQLVAGYRELIPKIFRSPVMVMALSLLVLFNITQMIYQNFFGLYATQNLGMPDRYLAYFPIVRSVIILIFLFWLQPILNRLNLRRPMLMGMAAYLAAYLMLILSPVGSLPALLGFVVLEAAAHAMVRPRSDTITALYIDKNERARIVSIMTVVWLAVSTPFGAIAGQLSSIDRRFPFFLILGLNAIALLIIAGSKTLASQRMEES